MGVGRCQRQSEGARRNIIYRWIERRESWVSLPEFSLQNSLILQSPEITGHYSFRLLGSYVILISNNISSLNTKHKMLCFKETLTLGIDVFYEPNNSKWVMAKRSSGNLVLPFRDSSIFVKISVTISRSVDW